jgi:hypothetical protein
MAEFYNLYGGAMLGQNVGVNNPKVNNAKVNNGKVNNAKVNNAKVNNGKVNNGKVNNNNGKVNNNNDKGNNDNDNDNDKNGNNLNNAALQRIDSIKLNTNPAVIGFWLIWIIAVFLLLSTYITTPIRYSEEFVVHTLTFNRFYYYLHIILLTLLCFYAYKSSGKLPLIKGDDIYQKVLPIVVFALGFLIINIFDSPGVKEDGSFNTPPSVIVKNKIGMIFHYIFLILCVGGIIFMDLKYSSGTMLGLQPYHINATLPALIVLVMCGYMLYNTARYYIKKYNLPNTWRK